ncbi:hypothetical protein DACRYDRAFT_22157 [Dacryopinax primogenitus]|uniref:Uncharacterized protein n=1 Tax=Dacryopinax primogenitus (strain DJM 731) TaxID=1858805 RepID=M5GCF4_DACPD|nr:uncharacterized protein DACRYDRAFT_22157 [Dacryopinax primogenitus]EJU01733.1 hypothetical protein DACRYDRAFT_22157 [Dacryopinax primogenitus]
MPHSGTQRFSVPSNNMPSSRSPRDCRAQIGSYLTNSSKLRFATASINKRRSVASPSTNKSASSYLKS